jgi:ribonuclease BN (tRNA processing enzyme)
VPHGPVPALAYRIRIGQQVIVLSGDHNGGSDSFVEFAQGADILVMQMPVPEGVNGVARNLHAPPAVIGSIAARSGAGQLVLSHFMARSLSNLPENLDEISSRYKGPVRTARDLDCFTIG